MARRKRDQPIIDFHFKSRKKDDQHLRVVEIVFLPTPDADDRMQRALDILLGPVIHEKADAEINGEDDE